MPITPSRLSYLEMGGNLGPALPINDEARWWVPLNLRIENEPDGLQVLAWDEVDPDDLHLSRSVRADSKALERFIALANAPDTLVLKFANKYGVLEVCEHFEHCWHDMPRQWCEPSRREPLDLWRVYARSASALLTVAAELHDGRPGNANDWSAVERWVGYAPPGRIIGSGKPLTPAQARQFVATAVQTWIERGRVGLSFGWNLYPNPFQKAHKLPFRPVPQIELTGRGLLNFIARQIVVRIARGGDVAMCSECKNGFMPSQKQRKYCESCQDKGAALKRAKREYRRRKRDEARGNKVAAATD